MTLRSAHAPRLRFAGAATFWDPPAADRDEHPRRRGRLGEVAARAGRLPRRVHVDGILSAEGWVATECNPRFGAGLHYTRAALPELGRSICCTTP